MVMPNHLETDAGRRAAARSTAESAVCSDWAVGQPFGTRMAAAERVPSTLPAQ